MPTELENLWKVAPVLAVLLILLWAGHKGLWYWAPGVRIIVRQLERERNEWRTLAIALLKDKGVTLAITAAPPPLEETIARTSELLAPPEDH